jgi:hypothetical protein
MIKICIRKDIRVLKASVVRGTVGDGCFVFFLISGYIFLVKTGVHFGGGSVARWRCIFVAICTSSGMRAAILALGVTYAAVRLEATPCAYRD